jgi:hypothetical protein
MSLPKTQADAMKNVRCVCGQLLSVGLAMHAPKCPNRATIGSLIRDSRKPK